MSLTNERGAYYANEISRFYDWLEINMLTDSAIVLWHALMHTSNRAGWPDEFTVATSTLTTKTGLKKDAINRARNRLQQSGRIDFYSRSGQQSAVYTIIPFVAFKTTQTASQTDSDVLNDANRVANSAQTASQSERKPLPLIRSNSLNQDQDLDREKEKDRLLSLVNSLKLKNVGALGLDTVYSYLGIVETGVIELAIKAAENKHLNYFVTTINNWISEGKTTVDLVLPKPQVGEPPEPKTQTSYGKSAKTGKPIMSVVKDEGPVQEVSPEERAKMRELARRLKEGTSAGRVEEYEVR